MPSKKRNNKNNNNNISSSSSNGGSKTPKPVATIDLHGCRKDQAIRNVTNFLEESNKKDGWVCIITGTGQHGQHGPVLRNAVRRLLEKRGMQHRLNPGKGSFSVRLHSGHVLYGPPPPTDTKVIVTPHQDKVNHLHRDRTKRLALPELDYEREHPLPFMVAQDDRMLERAKERSRKELRLRAKEEHRAQKELHQALLDSSLEFEKQQAFSIQDQDMLRRAMDQSMAEKDNVLERALSISAQESNNSSMLDPDLNEALKRSLEEESQDEELLRVLEMSRLAHEEAQQTALQQN